jgi:hypothetical protein
MAGQQGSLAPLANGAITASRYPVPSLVALAAGAAAAGQG